MTERAPLPPINFAALAHALLQRIDTLVPHWLSGGALKSNGTEYFVNSVWRTEKTPSLSVRMKGEKAGQWQDHGGSHAGGDLISLYAAIHGMDNGAAAVQLAREHGLESVADVQPLRAGANRPAAPPPPKLPAPPAAARREDPETWKTMLPAPEHPKATFWHFHRNNENHKDPIAHTAEYRMGGRLLGYVVRFVGSDGKKVTLPYTWSISERDGTCKWVWRHWDAPRPLYVPLGTMPEQRTVVLVEGEKKADVLQALLEAHAPGVYVVVSWSGGCKAWNKALWDWLAGCTVLLWPDCDGKRVPLTKAERDANPDELAQQLLQDAKPLLPSHKQVGMAAMLGIGVLLRDSHSCNVSLLPIPEPGAVPDGWDCADAINTDGWDFNRILEFFGRAQPLPSEASKPADAAGGGGGAKKPPTDSPAGAGDSDSDERGAGGGVMIGGKEIPWWLEPYYDHDKGRWLISRKTVIKALRHDPELEAVLGLNQLSNNIDARVSWPWAHAKPGPVTNSIDLLLGDFLTAKYGLPAISRAALSEGIETVSNGRPFHPIREWLSGLEQPKKKRIDKWLIHALGETPETLEPAMFEYLSLVGRYWLLGMVNRVMRPGCKFDYCPVLEGPGGYYKSTLVEVLAGTEYYSDTHFDVSKGKEGQEQVQGLWMYEIAELANFGKADIGLIKAFITAKSDRYRPSYGRVVEKFDRQCILVGTTNERTYLRDRTGNRRFWPVPVRNPIRIDWVIANRAELLAEAYALYQAGERFTPTPEDERRLFVPVQEKRLVETAVLSEMTHILTRNPTIEGPASRMNKNTAFVTISHITSALGVDAAKSSPALEGQIRSWLEHQGWEYVKKQINGARSWGYLRPKDWPKAEPEDDEDDPAPATPPPPRPPAPVSASPAAQFLNKEADDEPF
ncbi:MAG: VapE family protein [Acidovorax sp.]|nr:VapE family protein [Acidovorax sp.]